MAVNAVTVGDNFIAINIGKGDYSLYAHLQPGSLRVKVGDRVKRDQVIELLGNSGNSTEPHVHFQISSAPSFLIDSEGLPYAADFVIIGDCTGISRPCTLRSVPTMVKGGHPASERAGAIPEIDRDGVAHHAASRGRPGCYGNRGPTSSQSRRIADCRSRTSASPDSRNATTRFP